MLTTVLIGLGIAFVSILVGIQRWHLWLKWWEVLLMVPAPLAVCLVTYGVAVSGASTDQEIRTSWVERAIYDEAWNERQTRTRVISTGKTTTVQTYRVTVEHPPQWRVESAHGGSESITQARYNELREHWGVEPVFFDMHRPHYTKDGDRYVCYFTGRDETLVPFTSLHSYENRVRVAPSLFEYDQEITGTVFDYPGRTNEAIPSVIGTLATPEERHAFEVLNARLGHPHNVRVWALIRPDASPQSAWDQEVAWLGGHRNEIVIVVGVTREREVRWCRVFGWTQAETLKVRIRQEITAQDTLDLVPIASWLREDIPRSYEVRDMNHFNYLPVDISWWVYLLAFFLATGANVGLMVWLIQNEHHDHPHRRIQRLDRWQDRWRELLDRITE